MRMLGGGQPAAIPQVQALWRQRMSEMLADGSIDKTLLNYDPPGGNPLFREAMAAFLKRECGWDVTRENIAVMPSSQSACFLLFNLLAGHTAGKKRRILFPLLPEYIGYANQALAKASSPPACRASSRPRRTRSNTTSISTACGIDARHRRHVP
jgi:valine--pyruvate aminotransferase